MMVRQKNDNSFCAGECGEMIKIIVYVPKGGVGKTTTATTVAVELSKRGKKVLLIDLDTQGQDSYFLGVEKSQEDQKGIAHLINAYIQNGEKPLSTEEIANIMFQARPNLMILAGGPILGAVTKIMSTVQMRQEYTLTDALEPINSMGFDVVILDCSPGWDVLAVNAFFFADKLVAPVTMDAAAIERLSSLIERFNSVQKHHKHLQFSYILPTMLDRRTKNSEGLLAALRANFGDKVCTPIGATVKFKESVGQGQTIIEYDPASTGAHEYSAFVNLIEKMVETENDSQKQ